MSVSPGDPAVGPYPHTSVGIASAPEVLTGRQLTLYEALREKNKRLGNLYLGAISVLGRTDNPDRHAQSCLSLRELMVKLPIWVEGVPSEAKGASMRVKVREFATRWTTTRERTANLVDGVWSGTIDPQLIKAINAVDAFVTWFENSFADRRVVAGRMFGKLDPLGVPPASPIAERRENEWMDLLAFFNGVAHHNSEPTQEDVDRNVASMERVILDIFRPSTFEKHKVIDEIIKRGETDADA
jgi:hypothetical protein